MGSHAHSESKNSRFRHKAHGLITRLFCAECLPPARVASHGCLCLGYSEWLKRDSRFFVCFGPGLLKGNNMKKGFVKMSSFPRNVIGNLQKLFVVKKQTAKNSGRSPIETLGDDNLFYYDKRLSNGFTLIELLVVVLIIGILAAVALPQYEKAVMKAQYARMLTLLRSAVTAYEVYYSANGQYPSSFDDFDLSFSSDRSSCTKRFGPEIDCVSYDTFYLRLLGEGLPGVAVTLNPDKYPHFSQEADQSGYHWVAKNTLGLKGFYCKTIGLPLPKKDKHCTGEKIQPNWHGAWYKMN